MIVLVVEDGMTMRQLLCRALQRIDGVVVIEASDGADAFAKLSTIRPDVIMTDINMPAMDGFAFIERLRQLPDHRTTPVIIVTTEVAEADRKRARELGVTMYVGKPARQQDVVAALVAIAGPRAVALVSHVEPPELVFRVDYDRAEELLDDYTTMLSRGTLVVTNDRPLAAGTPIRLTLGFPGLVAPIALDGVVGSFSHDGGEPAYSVELADGPQLSRLAGVIDAIRAAVRR